MCRYFESTSFFTGGSKILAYDRFVSKAFEICCKILDHVVPPCKTLQSIA